jgi:toxin CptA
MHSAPSVSFPVGRSPFQGAVLLLVWLLGCGATGLWWFHSASPGWRPAAAWLLLGAAGGFAAWNWRRTRSGVVRWDGQSWDWSGEPHAKAGAVQVSLDLQRCLLLRWKSGKASHWLWLERDAGVERWDDLRRAVYSRARIEAPPESRPPAATP